MLLSMYEAIHDIWIAETGDCNSSYEDFRWAWFVGMYVPILLISLFCVCIYILNLIVVYNLMNLTYIMYIYTTYKYSLLL